MSLTIFGGLRASIRKHLFEPRRRMSLSRSRDPSQERPPQKPPSILVYSGNSSSLYRKIRDCLSFCLPADIYTVFNLSNDAIRSAAWIDPSSYCLLIADTVGLDDPAWHRLHQFFNQSGKIIFICQNRLLASFTNADSTKKQEGLLKLAFGDRSNFFGKEFETFLKKALKSLAKHNKVHETYHSKDIVDGAQFTVLLSKMPETPLLLYMENSVHRASAVFSDATTDEMLSPESSVVRDALSRIGVRVMETQNGPPPLTQGYLQMSPTKDWDQFESRILLGEAVGTSPRIFLRKSDKLSDLPIPEATSELLPIEITPSGSLFPSFDASKYFEILQAKTLGRCLIFVPVCTTTMDVCSSISSSWAGFEGVIVIARQQTHGRGRGGNEFISLPGTAMFTMNCTVRQNSALAERPSLIQHIMATAVAQAVSKLSGVEEFPFRIKWPNDFYFSRSHKVGGLLVTAKHRDNCIEFIIGVGVNVENSKPTVCLNDMLPEESTTEFSVESVIAETVTQFENLLFEFEMQGFEVFKERYESFWLHNREEVTLEDGDKVVIRGIDKNGYLSVKSRRTAKEFTIGDDGNTFDMMRGLIRHKLV
ncbi:unnamed protein product, partial [Mesorhabditis belari]|uniref:BPL/LPL catalytic domain-containing protein n=1 Tax=Mesorhabditis belari TaxID=2138241 RepID=A0AAF3FFF8_9BILA